MQHVLIYIIFGKPEPDFTPIWYLLEPVDRASLLSTCKLYKDIFPVLNPMSEYNVEYQTKLTSLVIKKNTNNAKIELFENFNTIRIGYNPHNNPHNVTIMGNMITYNSHKEQVICIGNNNKLTITEYCYLGNISIVGSNNSIYFNDFVVCRNISIVGNNLKIIFNKLVHLYDGLTIINNNQTLTF